MHITIGFLQLLKQIFQNPVLVYCHKTVVFIKTKHPRYRRDKARSHTTKVKIFGNHERFDNAIKR
jgi:hypothetical protein